MLFERIKQDQLSARKNRDSATTTSLSTLIGELQRSGGKDFDDAQVIGLIKKNVENLRENLRLDPENANNADIQREIDLFEAYLPRQMSEDELREAIRQLIADGATSIKELMPALQSHYKGQYDGRLASGLVKEELAKL